MVAGSPAVLIGAGNIARCDRTNDDSTGSLLNRYPSATVFTTGDNTNGNATLTNFNNCYDPSWGRTNKARTRPAVGENDYKQAAAAGFFLYFRNLAGDSSEMRSSESIKPLSCGSACSSENSTETSESPRSAMTV